MIAPAPDQNLKIESVGSGIFFFFIHQNYRERVAFSRLFNLLCRQHDIPEYKF